MFADLKELALMGQDLKFLYVEDDANARKTADEFAIGDRTKHIESEKYEKLIEKLFINQNIISSAIVDEYQGFYFSKSLEQIEI